MTKSLDTSPKKPYLFYTFGVALLLGVLIYLPFILKDGGRFFLYGDFNVQQVPFYQLAHQAVREGNIFWNWNTDLGVNFIGSYSFYLLFSPFFWLTLPFPNTAIPYLMAPLLILKTACAGGTAFLYLRRFVKDEFYAFFGGLLYAFSGWMTFNIFFNHFHEVAVFFPLLLLSVELLVTEDRRFFFALMVAVNATVNYWFFVGEVVFVLLYVFVRWSCRDWGMNGKKLGLLVFESVLGLGLAGVAVLPSVLAIVGNPRTGVERIHTGWGFWIYWHNSGKYGDYSQRIPAILSSLLYPPELAARPNMFHLHGAQWASLSAWLPLVSLSGVLGYFVEHREKRNWIKRLLGLCLFFALIPGLNSLFVLLNNAYYARWFYMPILIMVLATVLLLDKGLLAQKSIRSGIKYTLIPVVIIIIAVGLTPEKTEAGWRIGLARDPWMAWLWFGFVCGGLIAFGVVTIYYRYHKKYQQLLTGLLSVLVVFFGVTYFSIGRSTYDRSEEMIHKALGNRGKFSLSQEEFYRSDVYDDLDNLLMFWELPTIQAFHSIVPASVMEFYSEVGVERNEGSRPEHKYYPLRSLLSVKYLLVDTEKEDFDLPPDFTLSDIQNDYYIFENENFLPLGFGYTHWMEEEEFKEHPLSPMEKQRLLHRTVVLTQEDVDRYGTGELLPFSTEEMTEFSHARYQQDVAERKKDTVDTLTIDTKGFIATTTLDHPTFLFFSVPFDDGWSASLNGEDVPIYRTNIGFLGVQAPEGTGTFQFTYQTPGLVAGFWISLGALGIFLVYGYYRKKKIV